MQGTSSAGPGPTAAKSALALLLCALPLAVLADEAADDCADWDANGFFVRATVLDVAECVRSGVDLNARGERDRTPLHVAAMHTDRPLLITALAAAGGDLRVRDRRDHTPLHSAAMANDNPAVIAALVRSGADPNSPSLPVAMEDLIVPAGERSYRFYGFELWGTPWFFQNLESGREWTSASEGPPGEDPLVAAALFDGENPTVFSLLAELAAVSEPALAGDLDEAPVTASLDGNLGALTQFVGMLKARETHGLRPLHVAARFNDQPSVIAALVDAGARVDAPTVHDYTALHIAAGHARNPAVIAALLDAGATLEARDSADGTPLHVAASTSDTPSVVKALIAAGANVDARPTGAAERRCSGPRIATTPPRASSKHCSTPEPIGEGRTRTKEREGTPTVDDQRQAPRTCSPSPNTNLFGP